MSAEKNITIELDYIIESPITDVFDYLSNPVNDAQWQSSCDDVTIEKPGAEIRTGFKYQIHFSFLSRKMAFEAETSEYEPLKIYGYRSLSGPITYEGRYEFNEVPEGVHIKWQLNAIPGKFFGIIPRNLIKKTMLKKAGEDIERLQNTFKTKT